MEFITLIPNRSRLREINEEALESATLVEAAVAYVENERHPLLAGCWNATPKIPLRLWARYDSSIPVAPPVMRWFLDRKSTDFTCRLIPDYYHSKVIWWHGYGAYVGSANLTPRAWDENREAGVFYLENELEASGLADELRQFFLGLGHPVSHPLSEDIYQEALRFSDHRSELSKDQNQHDADFDKSRIIARPLSPHSLNKKPVKDLRRERFLVEWRDALEELRLISERVSSDDYRPPWITPDVPASLQADRFLHSYYKAHVRPSGSSLHRTLHAENRNRRETALSDALTAWRTQKEDPSTQSVFRDSGPAVTALLKADRILKWTPDDLAELCVHVHSMHDHGARVPSEKMGLRVEPKTREDRVRAFGRWLHSQKSANKRRTAAQTIHYLLYGGEPLELTSRIAELYLESANRVPHLSISSLGELAGWGLPSLFPLRNNRTNKSLFGLGAPVAVFGDAD
jgi:hypothetical protein